MTADIEKNRKKENCPLLKKSKQFSFSFIVRQQSFGYVKYFLRTL